MVPVALAMRAGLPIDAIRDTIHPYPTMSEAVWWAAEQLVTGKLDPQIMPTKCCAIWHALCTWPTTHPDWCEPATAASSGAMAAHVPGEPGANPCRRSLGPLDPPVAGDSSPGCRT
jgi:hypothetical protein